MDNKNKFDKNNQENKAYQMQYLIMYKIHFISYMKICILVGFAMGVLLGILFFVIGILGGDVFVDIGNITLSGFGASVVSLILLPCVMVFIHFIFSLTSFPVLVLVLKITRGIKIKAHLRKAK